MSEDLFRDDTPNAVQACELVYDPIPEFSLPEAIYECTTAEEFYILCAQLGRVDMMQRYYNIAEHRMSLFYADIAHPYYVTVDQDLWAHLRKLFIEPSDRNRYCAIRPQRSSPFYLKANEFVMEPLQDEIARNLAHTTFSEVVDFAVSGGVVVREVLGTKCGSDADVYLFVPEAKYDRLVELVVEYAKRTHELTINPSTNSSLFRGIMNLYSLGPQNQRLQGFSKSGVHVSYLVVSFALEKTLHDLDQWECKPVYRYKLQQGGRMRYNINTLEFIACPCSHPMDVVGVFDLGVCCVAYYHNQLICSPQFLLSAITMSTTFAVLSQEAYCRSSMRRLHKYVRERELGFCMPGIIVRRDEHNKAMSDMIDTLISTDDYALRVEDGKVVISRKALHPELEGSEPQELVKYTNQRCIMAESIMGYLRQNIPCDKYRMHDYWPNGENPGYDNSLPPEVKKQKDKMEVRIKYCPTLACAVFREKWMVVCDLERVVGKHSVAPGYERCYEFRP